MRVYTAGEAIGPAWEHTKALMWRDRRWGRLLKLCLVAIGAELGTSFSFNGNGFRHLGGNHAFATLLLSLGVVFGVVMLAVFVLCLYLGSRLQLVQFDMLVLRDPLVTPAWERHGRHTWRWAGLKMTILFGVLLVLLPLVVPVIPLFLSVIRASQPVPDAAIGHPVFHWGAFLIVFSEVVAILVVFLLLIRLITSLVLPGVALEDLSSGDALRRAWEIFRTDVPGMLWFAVLQPVFLAFMGLLLAVGVIGAALVFVVPVGLVVYALRNAMHSAGVATWILAGTVGAVTVIVIFAVVSCVYLVTSGTLLMFARAWSLYFLGGRYPLLGQYLEPGPAVPVWTPPPSSPRDEDGSGPGFPGNPALA